jgi:hypothetical protein
MMRMTGVAHGDRKCAIDAQAILTKIAPNGAEKPATPYRRVKHKKTAIPGFFKSHY